MPPTSSPPVTTSSIAHSTSKPPETPLPVPGSKSPSPTPNLKPGNVFSNDGSFLEKFQRLQKDDTEKKKQEEAFARKRTLDDRFKARGKRPSPDEPDPTRTQGVDVADVAHRPTKRPKQEVPLTDYQKQVKAFAGRSLKDEGVGVRPLVK